MNFGAMNKLLKQVQKMQEEMARLQEELAARTVEATAGGGAVRAVVTGGLELQRLEIAPEAIDPDDPSLLEDLVRAAVNEALRKARAMVQEEMGRLTGGLGLPPLPGLS